MSRITRVAALIVAIVAGLFSQSCGGRPRIVIQHSEYISASREAGEERVYSVIRDREQCDALLVKYHITAIPSFIKNIKWGNDRVLLITSDSNVTSATVMRGFDSFSNNMVVVHVVDEQNTGFGFTVLKGNVAGYIKFNK